MNKITLFPLSIFLVFVLISCTSNRKEFVLEPGSFVQFGSHQWSKESFDCNRFKYSCAVVKLDYPKAIFGDEGVRSNINGKIQSYVETELAKALTGPHPSGESVTELAESALAGYDPYSEKSIAELSIFGQLLFRNKNLIKLELSSFMKNNKGDVKSNRSLYTFDTQEGNILSQTVLNNGVPKLAAISLNK